MRLGGARLRRPRRDHHLGSDQRGRARTRQDPHFEVTPEDAGLKRVKPEALRGGDAAQNAKALLDVLKGKPGRSAMCRSSMPPPR
jgi:Anthranilate phosphoribosyltransferase